MDLVVNDRPPAPTSDTMIDVEVEELWTRTVTSTPIMRPHTGLLTTGDVNRFPAVRPEHCNTTQVLLVVDI